MEYIYIFVYSLCVDVHIQYNMYMYVLSYVYFLCYLIFNQALFVSF